MSQFLQTLNLKFESISKIKQYDLFLYGPDVTEQLLLSFDYVESRGMFSRILDLEYSTPHFILIMGTLNKLKVQELKKIIKNYSLEETKIVHVKGAKTKHTSSQQNYFNVNDLSKEFDLFKVIENYPMHFADVLKELDYTSFEGGKV